MRGFQSRNLPIRSEEHTSELQSHDNIVCGLLLEKEHGTDTACTTPERERRGQHSRARRADAAWRRVEAHAGVALDRHGCTALRCLFFFNHRPPPEIFLLPPQLPVPI